MALDSRPLSDHDISTLVKVTGSLGVAGHVVDLQQESVHIISDS